MAVGLLPRTMAGCGHPATWLGPPSLNTRTNPSSWPLTTSGIPLPSMSATAGEDDRSHPFTLTSQAWVGAAAAGDAVTTARAVGRREASMANPRRREVFRIIGAPWGAGKISNSHVYRQILPIPNGGVTHRSGTGSPD